jgi:hypothetical protein
MAKNSDAGTIHQTFFLTLAALCILAGSFISAFMASSQQKILAVLGCSTVVVGLGGFGLAILMGQPGERAPGAWCGVYLVPLGMLACMVASLLSLFLRSPKDSFTCRKCGYDIRGLPEPRCPECGTPFDPKWLQKDRNA